MHNAQINQLIEQQIAEIAMLQGSIESDPNYFPPTVPTQVFNRLPPVISDLIGHYSSEEEKSIALLSALTTISSALSNINIQYRTKDNYCNLFQIIVGPPASNKSIALHSRLILKKIQFAYNEEYNQKKREYIHQLQKLKQSKNKEHKQEDGSINYDELDYAIKKPKLKHAIIPADASAASLIDVIYHNGGSGLVFDSEAQTFTNTIKQDYGVNLKTTLLKSFENEHVEISRKSLDDIISIENARISVLLTGNPEHLFLLVKSISDGFYSRFAIFQTKNQEWKDANNVENLKDYSVIYSELADVVFELHNKLNKQDEKYKFSLTEEQLIHFNHFFKSLYRLTSSNIDPNFSSVIYRLALNFYRYCAILGAIRESGNLPYSYHCNNEDFMTAIEICSTVLKHFLFFEEPVNQSSEFYNLLPEEFTRAEYLAIGKTLKMGTRTIDSKIQQLFAIKKIEKISHGKYKKKAPAILQNVQYEEPIDSAELSKVADVNEISSVHSLELPSNDWFTNSIIQIQEMEKSQSIPRENTKMDEYVKVVLTSCPFEFDEEFEAAVYSIFQEDLSYFSKEKYLIPYEFTMGIQSKYSLSDKGINHIVSKLKELNIIIDKEDGTIIIKY